MLKKFVLLCIMLLLAQWASAQLSIRQRKTKIIGQHASIKLDSLSIVPGTFILRDSSLNLIDSVWYDLNYVSSVFRWKGKEGVSLWVQYRVMPLALNRVYFHKDYRKIQELPIDNSAYYQYSKPSNSPNLFNIKGLEKSGSISRSILFGNNQNLSVNSNMNLQLAGKIANDIEISAAIADDNLPIQPEGNTQQLNEFDKVYIQLKRDSSTLIAGDFEIQRPESYFMNFYKRSQGAMLGHQFATRNKWKLKSALAIAVAKGRYTRQNFNGEEGNQGPYRLSGNQGESYIVILAGSERVYLDGILLVRGQDNDYTINYNTAEISFTTKQAITRNSRISIEFEYSDKNYSRTLTYFNQQVQHKGTNIKFNYFNEKDNKNQPFLQNLSDSQKQFLSSLGPNIDQAYYPNISEVPFNENEVLYEKISPMGGDTYYQYSTDPLKAKYRLDFSYVGEGKGNYQLDNNTAANGRVYKYTPPISGVKQGAYEAITLLISPKQQQMFSLGVEQKTNLKGAIGTELALSNYNVNLFADRNSTVQQGLAVKLNGHQGFALNNKGLQLNTLASFEHSDQHFKPIERYRDVEFDRDFNLNQTFSPANEQLWKAALQLQKGQQYPLEYRLQHLVRTSQYEGTLHELRAEQKFQKYRAKYLGSLLQNHSTWQKGSFVKHQAELSRDIFGLIAGLGFEQQDNRSRTSQDSLSGNSFAYQIYKAFVENGTNAENRFRLEYNHRTDDLPSGKQLLTNADSHGIKIEANVGSGKISNLELTLSYLKTNYKNTVTPPGNAENLLARVAHRLKAFKGWLTSNFFYELGNGQEPKREMTYLEVLPGQGTYAWNDYNGNGIKELNEFEIAAFADQARFIQIYTVGTQYQRSNFTGINHHINLQAAPKNNRLSGLAAFLARFSNELNYKIDRKITGANGWEIYNPFYTDIALNNLVSLNALIRNSLFFNRNNPKFGMEFLFLADGGKSLLNSGFDSRKRKEWGNNIRWSPWQKIAFRITWLSGEKAFRSDLFSQRNYQIRYFELKPEVNFMFNNDLRLGTVLGYNQQHNAQQYGGEKNYRFNSSSELRYNIVARGVLNAKFSYIHQRFTGQSNSSLGYEMLSGLQNGNNYNWGFGLQRSLSNGIQLNLSYEGRKSPLSNTVHTGNMQVRAYF